MKKLLSFIILIIVFTSCASTAINNSTQDSTIEEKNLSDNEIFEIAIFHSKGAGRKVLEKSREMIDQKKIIVGGCWDYINGVYNLAGFKEKNRSTVYKSKFHGPYADTETIEAGDWLYFVNHTYNDIEHSAIFVSWIDQNKKEALMVNYVGGKQKKPATLKRFVLDNVYNIIRGHED